MKKLLLCVLPILMFGKVHYAKVEPLERATIKASVGGTITKVDLSAEGRIAGGGVVIQIDDQMDRISLKTSQDSLKLFQETLQINQEIVKGLEETYGLKKDYFDRVNGLESSTQTQKDNAYNALIGAKNQLLGTKEKIVNLKKQILDLEYKISMLQDSIAKKQIVLKGRYLYKIMVRAGEFAASGLPLAVADDLSKAKLTIYLDRDELKDIQNKKAYIDGAEDGVAISRIWREADEKFISAYRAEILLEPTHPFSTLLKIEVK
jgi:multidrug resistance efflux pump